MTKKRDRLQVIQGGKSDDGSSFIGDPPPDAPPAPDAGMVWANWTEGPAGWEYPEDITS